MMPVIQAEIPTREYAVSFSYKYSSEPAGFLAHSWMIFRINSEDLLLTSGVRGERQPSAVGPPPPVSHLYGVTLALTHLSARTGLLHTLAY